jgi:light-regulated signal transduction histidine kinase (bacteriophytochrome)
MDGLVKSVKDDIEKTTPHRARVIIHPLNPLVADRSLINQVMVNLLSNAIKYSSGAESPVVEVKSYKEDGEVVYEVKDNGAGFNNLYVDKLFGVFQRLHSNEEFEGTGVGLALVKRIITKHGGKVWANGEVNKGATFYFSLPEN